MRKIFILGGSIIPFGKDSIPIVLPRELVQDIDTPEDFRRAEIMYSVLHPDSFDE